MKNIIYLSVVLFLFGCSDAELPAGKRGEAFQLADTNKQKQVLVVMEDRKIPFKLDEHGFVVYLLRDQADVHGILRKVEYGDNLNHNTWESAVLVDQLTREKYEAAFQAAGIPYDISEQKGVVQINWSQTYGPQVDILRQKLAE